MSSDVLKISIQKNGEGTFSAVSIGHIKTTNFFVRLRKDLVISKLYLKQECCVLQSLVGCGYFPYVFGVFHRMLVIKLITCEDNKMVIVSSIQKENKLISTDWNVIYFNLASAVKYVHLKNLLHNDLSNNILLKLRNNVWIPNLADMGEVILKSNLETYKRIKTQKEHYNKIYPHFPYELGNVYGSKASFSSDIYSLGYMFKHLYHASPILRMLTSKMPSHDLRKDAFNTLQSCIDFVQENGYYFY